jgi:hypothetical protein
MMYASEKESRITRRTSQSDQIEGSDPPSWRYVKSVISGSRLADPLAANCRMSARTMLLVVAGPFVRPSRRRRNRHKQ